MTYDLYVGYCSHGKPRAAMVDNPERREFTAKEIGSWIMNGLTVQRAKDSPPIEVWQCDECDAARTQEETE